MSSIKNYSAKLYADLQEKININEYEIENIQSSDDLPKIVKLNGFTIFLTDDGKRKDVLNKIDEDLSGESVNKWRQTAIGKFYSKDWKKGNKGEETFNLYKILKIYLKGLQVNALIRKISASEFLSIDEHIEYTDLTINGESYAIMKAYLYAEIIGGDDFIEGFSCDSILEEKKFGTDKIVLTDNTVIEDEMNFGDIPDIADESEEDQDEMVELF